MTYQETSRFPYHRTHWQDWCNLILGAWLFLSPWILQFGEAGGRTIAAMNASWNAWILGIIVFLVSVGATFRNEAWPEWLDFALGIWIFFAPWFLGFAGLPMAAWNHWIVGALIVILGFWNASTATSGRPSV